MGIRAPSAWAELQHHGRQTLPPGTQRGLQPTNWYIWEHLTGAPRFLLGLGGDMDIRNDDRGTVDAAVEALQMDGACYANREGRLLIL